ncbi:MAG TPA: YidB family protein [Steroidobacteraceae bacterium]|nr:YidB family protein [Steroidobacteraceae bacterium]
MGFLDGLLSGIAGAEAVSLVSGLIEKHGGVPGVLAQLQQQGLRETAKSWVESGANLPISPDQVHQVFGADTIKELAARAGLDPQEALQKLSQALPQAIDRLTPAA